MFERLIVLFILLEIYFTKCYSDFPQVVTSHGMLRGVFLNSTQGRTFAAFMSIPFAKPPVGGLRFKAPVEIESWTGVRDASMDSPFCIQKNPYTRKTEVEGSEDCLYLNIYTPKINSVDEELLPVMIFFHGGGWMCGSGNKFMYGPERLMDRDVVYVGVNYRVGLLGTFSTEDENAPGNYVLKDQNMGMRWIQKNIKYFGGNPKSITIFGESAGGASVHYHILSPKSKGLFHKAISHSGSALCAWANAVPQMTTKRMNSLAQSLNCPTDENFALVECLRSKTAEEVTASDMPLYDWDYDPMIPFRPLKEPEHEDAFLTEDPRKLIQDGEINHVPWILGMNSKEGALRVANLVGNPELCSELERNFDKLAPITFDYQYAENSEIITNAIKKYYLKNNVSGLCNDSIYALTNIYSDAHFLSGLDETIRLHLGQAKEPMYFYYFDYKGSSSFAKIFGDSKTDYGGACHVDELIYLFDLGFPNYFNEEEKEVSSKLLTLWINFATTGNPNKPQNVTDEIWKPIKSVENLQYLKIGKSLSMKDNLLKERRNFWHHLPLWHKISPSYNRAKNDEL